MSKAFKILKEKLTCASVIISPNWSLPFKLNCDASDFTVGAILDEETSDDSEVDDNFPGETFMEINTKDEPWFADYANYLVSDIIPKGMTYQQKTNISQTSSITSGREPYLFKVCSDSMIRRCIFGRETQTILDQCQHGPTSGHYGPNTTAKKVLDSGYYWPTIIKEAHTQVRLCEACQKTRNISKGSLEVIPSSKETKFKRLCILKSKIKEKKGLKLKKTQKMDQDSAHMVAASKVPMLKPGEFEIWRMRIKQYIQMMDYALWEVIENGDTLPKIQVLDGVTTVMPIITAEEKAQRRLEVKVKAL
nr:reverse transcriptase domain-containing protein [Tanacetum cinerariifolium]